MATIHLPPDFKEFLRLLNAHISLKHLKLNKQASGRHQDLADLEKLP
ncbi:MAG: hypothetical protein JW993_01485 [Sedimentisphaerales bacterium]|nr:hypothetical protein [Sedimentisphaerales bacterium]